MRALIIAGGFGTRLRPLTDKVPKPLLPIANRPFLEHQIRLLVRHGVRDVTLLTGYLPEGFEPFAARMRALGATLDISTEDKPLGTAGAVRTQLERLDGPALVLNGDVLTSVDIARLVAFHAERGAAITQYLTWVENSASYGVLRLDDDDRVQAFVQNAKVPEVQPGAWINAGLYVIEPKVLERVPADTEWSFEYQLFPEVLEAGEPFFGFRSDAYWIDIGTPTRYLQAHLDILDGKTDVEVDGRIMTQERALKDGTVILPPVLLSHAPVGANVVLGPHVSLGPESVIEDGARVERSVVHARARVGEGAEVRDSIIGEGAEVPAHAIVTGEVLV